MSEPIEVNGFNGGPTEMDQAVDAFITETAAEFKAEGLDAELESLAATPGDSPAGGTAPPEEGKAAETVADPGTAAPPSPEDRGMARLVEREVALRAKETELSSREAGVARLEARIKELEARVIPADLGQHFDTDPEAALTALGQDPDLIVRQIIAKRLGKTDDPQVKAVISETKRDRRIAELEAKLDHQNQVAKAQAFVAKVENGAREHVHKGIGEDAPTVAAVAKANPDRVYREIMEEISRDAAEKARGSGGDVLTYSEAVSRVERRWAEFRSLVAPPAAPQAPAPASTKSEETAGTTAPKPPPTATKPPDRPLAPWLQKTDLESEGIRAGMAEFIRSEKR